MLRTPQPVCPFLLSALLLLVVPRLAFALCPGDCDDDGSVSVAEVVTGVNIAFERMPMTSCAAIDFSEDAAVTVDELVRAVSAAIRGCNCAGADRAFDATFAAIQEVIFENRGCINDTCHGAAVSGGLDLRGSVAYANLIEVPSSMSAHPRIQPGEPGESFLYLKLQAATLPGRVQIAGGPMPVGLAPISESELEAVRLWIEAGAPETGAVGDSSNGDSTYVASLLDACLPEAEPVTIRPLEPPADEEGIQIEMPPYVVPAQGEVEYCFAAYVDLTDRVPARFKDPTGKFFYANGSRLRQDPQSHHLIISHSGLDASAVNHPSFGRWTCRGGPLDGQECEPTDLSFCGEGGLCGSAIQNSPSCIGFGPPEVVLDTVRGGIGGAQTAQEYSPPRDGVFREVPLSGILYFNSHAFNLTRQDHVMHARLNLFYTDDLRFERIAPLDASHIYVQAGQPPFTEETYCADHVLPRGAELIQLSSHTHKRGVHFWAHAPDGTRIYESFIYSDPVNQKFDPPLLFDSADPAERTLHYCATYNNGVAADGTPDTHLVTRLSTMPDRTTCRPVACVEGRIGAPCAGADDDASCDSSPGAGDGWCDACPITAGVTTENEMFLLSPQYTLPVEE